MKTFNFIEAAGHGYQFIWDQRRPLASLAVLPLAVKFGCVALILFLDLQGNYLRQGLALLPGYFLEGWLVAMAIRLAVFGESWLPGAQGLRVDEGVKRLVLASAILYTLTKLFVSLSAAFLISVVGMNQGTPPAEAPPGSFAALLTLTFVSIWLFRFLWMYVPMAMNIPLDGFMRRIIQVPISLPMLAVWMLCMVPAAVVLFGISGILRPMMMGAAEGDPAVSFLFVMSCFEAVMETIIALVSGVAMAFAFREFFGGKPGRSKQ